LNIKHRSDDLDDAPDAWFVFFAHECSVPSWRPVAGEGRPVPINSKLELASA
jgi:hypothetical protein